MGTKSRHGHELLRFLSGDETDLLSKFAPVTAAMVIAEWDGNILTGFNRFRKSWELPAGRIEGDESVRDCALREFSEESGQRTRNLLFKGLAHIRRANRQLKFTAVYWTRLPELVDFRPNNEWSAIHFCNPKSVAGDIDEVDFEIARFVLE